MAPKGDNSTIMSSSNNNDVVIESVVKTTTSAKITHGSSVSGSVSDSSDRKKMVKICTHPCLKHKISILRSSTTPPSLFRALMREITYNLAYEATYDLSLKDVEVSVCNEDEPVLIGSKLEDQVALIPVLRSGLGMVDALLELVPQAEVHHIGMYTNKFSNNSTTADEESMPVQYYNKLPKKCHSDVAYVLDPVLASGNTAISVVGILKKWGVPRIRVVSIVASDIGLKKFQAAHPDVQVTIGALDECKILENGKFKFTGLGDAGDRLFGTNNSIDVKEEDEALITSAHKRKRTMSVENAEAAITKK